MIPLSMLLHVKASSRYEYSEAHGERDHLSLETETKIHGTRWNLDLSLKARTSASIK
jgi:hypothetical protein